MAARNKIFIICHALTGIIFTILYGCTKHADITHSTTDTTTQKTLITGNIYEAVSDSIKKFDVKTGAILWGVPNSYASFAPTGPLIYNAGGIYNGSAGGTKGYNALTGAGLFQVDTNDPSISQYVYEVPAFAGDSLAVINSSTGVYIGAAQMNVFNKITGKKEWSVQIDSGGTITDNYFAVPLAVNNRIVVLQQDASNNYKICCYDPNTGVQVWQSDWNPYLSGALKTSDNNIFSLQGGTIWSYSGTNGTMLWQTTTMVAAGSAYTDSWFDAANIYIAREDAAGSYYSVLTVNKVTGKVLSTVNVPLEAGALAHYACHYQDGVFYVMDYIDTNTDYNGVLYAYSFPSMQLKWSYKFTWMFSPYRAPVITDKYVIFPVSAGKVVNQATLAAKMVFLDLNGKLVNEFSYHGFPSKFLYVDETGTPYATDVY